MRRHPKNTIFILIPFRSAIKKAREESKISLWWEWAWGALKYPQWESTGKFSNDLRCGLLKHHPLVRIQCERFRKRVVWGHEIPPIGGKRVKWCVNIRLKGALENKVWKSQPFFCEYITSYFGQIRYHGNTKAFCDFYWAPRVLALIFHRISERTRHKRSR